MKLSGRHYLVYDAASPSTDRLKASLVREGATVHVTSSILVAQRYVDERSIDAAFVPFRGDAATASLCKRLDRQRIPKIFTGSSPRVDQWRLVA
jgi:hypothetical protein